MCRYSLRLFSVDFSEIVIGYVLQYFPENFYGLTINRNLTICPQDLFEPAKTNYYFRFIFFRFRIKTYLQERIAIHKFTTRLSHYVAYIIEDMTHSFLEIQNR